MINVEAHATAHCRMAKRNCNKNIGVVSVLLLDFCCPHVVSHEKYFTFRMILLTLGRHEHCHDSVTSGEGCWIYL